MRITSGQPRTSIPNTVSTSNVYIPQGRNIAPVRSQIPIVNQSLPQQVGNRVTIGGSLIPVNQPVMNSFPQNPQNLRYW